MIFLVTSIWVAYLYDISYSVYIRTEFVQTPEEDRNNNLRNHGDMLTVTVRIMVLYFCEFCISIFRKVGYNDLYERHKNEMNQALGQARLGQGYLLRMMK